MKKKITAFTLVFLGMVISWYAFANPCATNCVSTDPLEVAQCLLECEDPNR